MPTWTYIKKGGAPSGTVHIAVANDAFVIDDAGNSSITTTDPKTAGELAGVPILQLQGGSPTNVDVQHVIEQISLVDGVLSKPGPNGTTIPISSGALPNSVVSRSWDYLVTKTAGGGAQAINGATGAIDFTTVSTTDHSAVFQSVINALAVHNGGAGGKIAFKGQFVWASQVILYPGIGLVGQGPLANKGQQPTGALIQSTYNGATLLLTGVNATNENYFQYLADFTMYGQGITAGYASQNLIQIDNSGGQPPFDVFIDKVLLFDAGQHGIYANAAGKLWVTDSYLEGCIGDGIQINGAQTVQLKGCYIFGQTGRGVNVVNGSTVTLISNRIWSNAQGTAGVHGVDAQGCTEFHMLGCSLANNGAASDYAMYCHQNTVFPVVIVGNTFSDTRGVNAVNRFLRLGTNHAASGSVTGNQFAGQKASDAIFLSVNAANAVTIANNQGFNDVIGQYATPFNATGPHVGMESGGAAAPTASTTYKVVGAPIYCSFVAGTAVSITIADAKANTIASGLTTFTGRLEPGMTINFGAFTVAPTVYVGVV